MSDTPLISVVIPVYKVEQYLNECVDSVINQTYENLDIILVDDGSPDNCPAMCDDYARKDSRIRVIHKPNGGLSDARNSGIDIAHGEYITFIDSDDYVSRTYVEQLCTIMKASSAGIVQCVHSSEAHEVNDAVSTSYEIYSPHDAIKIALRNKRIARAAWGKLYKLSMFAENERLRYPEGLVMEDLYVMPEIFDAAGSFALTDSTKYFYRLRDDSIWLKPFDSSKLDYFTSIAHVKDYLTHTHPDLLAEAEYEEISNSVFILRKALQTEPYDSPVISRIFSHIKDGNIRRFMFGPNSLKKKAVVALLVMMPKAGFRFLRAATSLKLR
ncbi:MAG: glycosyltransferase [Synergistaceae bacterium]|nr:glycosyltransferase [Synergistaceae bacterium]